MIQGAGLLPRPDFLNERESFMKKVAIVGCTAHKDLAPFNDQEFEIWGMNNLYHHIPRFSRWFEIHPIKFENGHFWRRDLIRPGVFIWSKNFRGQSVDDYVQGLSGLGCPVYMQQGWPNVPNGVVYPLQEVLNKFGNYFTNSVSYMLALAIYEGFEEIHVYGVDMAVDTEYHHQRPSCEYFLGLAAGMGIKIHVPAESDLLKTRFLYGFQEQEASDWDKKIRDMQTGIVKRRQEAEQKRDHAVKQIEQYIGAETAMREIGKIWQ